MAKRTRQDCSRPAIGVTGNAKRFSPSWLCIRFSLWLSGGIPRRIKPGDNLDIDSLAGLVISGGDDIHPTLYGQKPAEKIRYDQERDRLEIACIEYALRTGTPLLGICRGHQLINVVMGGTLYTSLAAMRIHTSSRRSLLPKKRVWITSPSTLGSILENGCTRVNSLHSQAIAEVPKTLQPVAFDDDQIIQAVESSSGRPLLGVQWHPEYLCLLPSQLRLFRWLVTQARSSQPA